MGALVSIFQGDNNKGNDIFLDFEGARPQGEEESQLYERIQETLREGAEALLKITSYEGCGKQIRAAMSKPSPETEKEAWVALLPAIAVLKEIYDYSLKLQDIFPVLLNALMKDDDQQSLVTKQALAKQLADVFDFVLQFDDAKMMNPAIQNDFSYYRRYLARIKHSKENMDDIVVRDDLANRMSLFFAHATPMMRVVTETTVNYLENEGPENNVTKASVVNGLALMANVCYDMVHKKKYENNDTNMFCLRSMTGCIILVDHIHPQGAFYKKSPIKIKSCITILKTYEGNTQGLLSALTYTTTHLNDPETPSSIKALLQ